jgi:branched-chain amino acid transport system substrate-binding protein
MMSKPLSLILAGLAIIGCMETAHSAEDPVVLGQTLSLSGGSAKTGNALLRGREACAAWVNRRGGVGKRPLKLATRDDGGDARRAEGNLRDLLERERIVAFLGPMGPAINEAVLPWATSSGVAVIAPFGGEIGIRAKEWDSVYFVTANQSVEAERLASHVSVLALTRLAIVHSLDANGRAALVALEEALAIGSIAPVAVLAVKADGSDAASTMRSLGSANAHAVLLATHGTSTSAMLQALSSIKGSGGLLQIYGMSSSASMADLAVLGQVARGFSMTQVLPSPRDPRSVLAAQFREALPEAANAESYVELEGCLSVLATAEVLRRRSTELSRAGVLRAFKTAGSVSVGGFEIDFANRTRGSTFTDIVHIGAGGKAAR